MFWKELRGGNYVKGEPVSIPKLGMHSDGLTQITPYGIHILSEQKETEKPIYEPIPLTEEWLKLLGFELNEDEGDVKYFQLEKYGVKSEEEMEFYFYKGEDLISTLAEIKYVHQLQNLYFILTNKELTKI